MIHRDRRCTVAPDFGARPVGDVTPSAGVLQSPPSSAWHWYFREIAAVHRNGRCLVGVPRRRLFCSFIPITITKRRVLGQHLNWCAPPRLRFLLLADVFGEWTAVHRGSRPVSPSPLMAADSHKAPGSGTTVTVRRQTSRWFGSSLDAYEPPATADARRGCPPWPVRLLGPAMPSRFAAPNDFSAICGRLRLVLTLRVQWAALPITIVLRTALKRGHSSSLRETWPFRPSPAQREPVLDETYC